MKQAMRRRCAALALAALAGCAPATGERSADDMSVLLQRPTAAEGPYPVTSVIDGDTLRVRADGRSQTVRALGIDTPETGEGRRPRECFGREASRRARELLEGRSVWLESDGTQARADRYGRTLAYVWLGERQQFNYEMVREGFAQELSVGRPHVYQREFREAEGAASEALRGLWSPDSCAGTSRPR